MNLLKMRPKGSREKQKLIKKLVKLVKRLNKLIFLFITSFG